MLPRRILVPVSFGPSSEIAFKEAARLAATTGARLIVVNVIRTPWRLFHGGWGSSFDEQTEQAKRERRERLEDFVKRELDELGLSVAVEEVSIEDEDIVDAILRIARDYKIDLMVLGPHRESYLDELFLNKNLHRLIDEAPCNVIVAKGGPEGEQAESAA